MPAFTSKSLGDVVGDEYSSGNGLSILGGAVLAPIVPLPGGIGAPGGNMAPPSPMMESPQPMQGGEGGQFRKGGAVKPDENCIKFYRIVLIK